MHQQNLKSVKHVYFNHSISTNFCGINGDFYLFIYCVLTSNQQGRKEMFYLTTLSTHFIYGYMASDIW